MRGLRQGSATCGSMILLARLYDPPGAALWPAELKDSKECLFKCSLFQVVVFSSFCNASNYCQIQRA